MPAYNIKDNNLILIKIVNFKNKREIQRLTENNLEELFNLKFIASNFQVENLRIDTLAFSEETNSFVIIGYKNTKNYSVIDQGYSYLALLLNNKDEFVLRYNQTLNQKLVKEDFDFSKTRVMFIAPGFNVYQLNAVQFSDISFELWKVSKFSNDMVEFDKVNEDDVTASLSQITNEDKSVTKDVNKLTEKDYFKDKTVESIEFYKKLKARVFSAFDDVEISVTKLYIGFRINKVTITSIVFLKKDLNVFINAKNLNDYKNLTYDVSNKGHWGIGDYRIRLESENDFDYFMELFKQAYYEKL